MTRVVVVISLVLTLVVPSVASASDNVQNQPVLVPERNGASNAGPALPGQPPLPTQPPEIRPAHEVPSQYVEEDNGNDRSLDVDRMVGAFGSFFGTWVLICLTALAIGVLGNLLGAIPKEFRNGRSFGETAKARVWHWMRAIFWLYAIGVLIAFLVFVGVTAFYGLHELYDYLTLEHSNSYSPDSFSPVPSPEDGAPPPP